MLLLCCACQESRQLGQCRSLVRPVMTTCRCRGVARWISVVFCCGLAGVCPGQERRATARLHMQHHKPRVMPPGQAAAVPAQSVHSGLLLRSEPAFHHIVHDVERFNITLNAVTKAFELSFTRRLHWLLSLFIKHAAPSKAVVRHESLSCHQSGLHLG